MFSHECSAMHNTMHYNTMPCSAIHYTTYTAIQCNTVQYNTYTTLCTTIQCSAVEYTTLHTLQYNAIQYNIIHTLHYALQYNAVQWNTLLCTSQYTAIRCNALYTELYTTVHCSTVQCNNMRHNRKQRLFIVDLGRLGAARTWQTWGRGVLSIHQTCDLELSSSLFLIRHSSSLSSVKSKLKIHLFSSAH